MILYADASSKGAQQHTGPVGWAFVLLNEAGQITEQRCGHIGPGYTIHDGEYEAVSQAVAYCVSHGILEATIYTDSMLVLRQTAGSWACNYERLRARRDALRILLRCGQYTLCYTPRKENRADKLSRETRWQAERLRGESAPDVWRGETLPTETCADEATQVPVADGALPPWASGPGEASASIPAYHHHVSV